MLVTTIETYTGQKVDLAKPDHDAINVNDISWHLSRQAKFLGATTSDNVYSIAQHSVLVLNRVRQLEPDASIDLLITALLHEAPAAYIGDLVKSIGQLLDLAQPLRRLEDRLRAAIYTGLLKDHRFNGRKFVPYIGPVMKEAGDWVTSYEAYHLMHSRGKWYSRSILLDEEFIMRNFIVWTPAQAQRSFLNHYRDLTS